MNDSRTYRLHHVPFFWIWFALIGVAWLSAFVGGSLLSYVRDAVPLFREMASWIYLNARWIDGMMLGAFIGGLLALVQPWLIRWRYGFVPRFWRIATFVGAILASALFSNMIYNNGGYTNSAGYWVSPNHALPLAFWFITLALVQMLALWPVVHRAWLYLVAGIGAFAFGYGIYFLEESFNTYDYGYSNPMSILFYGSVAQAVFSGLSFLWLMRDYRVEAVPKRDEKAKLRQGMGLHPMSFMGLWTMAFLFGWVAVLSLGFMAYSIGATIPPLRDLISVIFSNQWIAAGTLGLLLGGATALPQPWLMKQRSDYSPNYRLWLILSAIGWTIGGLAIPNMNSSYTIDQNGMPRYFLMLLAWFALPIALQSLAFIRDKRSFWLYALAGIVSAVMAYFVNEQLDWTYSGPIYAIVVGAGLQAVLTGTAFLVMMAQNRQIEAAPVETIETTELVAE
jgi:hypothetical protein